MAVVVIANNPGGSAQQDQAVRERLNLTNESPPGSILRASGPYEGGWRVISVWESEEAFNTFRRERLEPALQAAGRPLPEFQIWPVENLVTRSR